MQRTVLPASEYRFDDAKESSAQFQPPDKICSDIVAVGDILNRNTDNPKSPHQVGFTAMSSTIVEAAPSRSAAAVAVVGDFNGGGGGGTVTAAADRKEAVRLDAKSKALMSKFFTVKGDMELMIAKLHNQLDQLRLLEGARSEAKSAIVRWNEEFRTLCGFSAEDGDKRRAKVFTRLAKNLDRAQQEFASFHPQVQDFAMTTRSFYLKNIESCKEEYKEFLELLSRSHSDAAVGVPASPAVAPSSFLATLEVMSVPSVPIVLMEDPYLI